jgi:YD repeat-containing protein
VTKSPAGQTMTYDGENRLVTFCSDASCTQRTQYIYDAAGNRVQQTDSNATASGTTTFVYDAFGNLAAEYGGATSAAGTQYLTVDALGSTRLVMGTQGTERHDFRPYGDEIAATESASGAQPWRPGAGYGADTVRQKFTGQEPGRSERAGLLPGAVLQRSAGAVR